MRRRVVQVAKKGGSRKLKRLAAPRTYKIPRKIFKWAVKTMPGPHPADSSIPVAVLLRDVLGVAKNLREVKYILRRGYFKIDGKVIREYKYPVGLMDVIELVPTKEFYRIMPDTVGYLKPKKITGDETRIKPLRIKNKVMVKGAKIQLTTHDGRNFLVDGDSELYNLKPGDTILYDFVSRKVIDVFRMEPGNYALVVWGRKRGASGKIVNVWKPHPLKPKMVIIQVDDRTFETVFDYVFPIGREEPAISID